MALRQEQWVLVGAVALVGYLAYGALTSAAREKRLRPAGAPEFEHHPAPDLDVALARERDPAALERALFSPPRDTRPLPPLDFEAPPLQPLASLRPAPAPGVAPALFGQFLRGDLELVAAPGLFEEEELVAEASTEEFAVAPDEEQETLSPEERMERIAGYKKLYDSVNYGSLHFGQIQNEDRFRLEERPGEAILFVEFDPATGQPRFPGQGAIPVQRERVQSFDFADTPENRIELQRLRFTGELTQGQYLPLMTFADWCFTQRLETPRALEVAVEMYTKATPMDPTDPQPRLRLALCHERRFEFEQAFAIYDDLARGEFTDHPLVLASLASLEARFRMTRKAEEHFAAAERFGRSEWEVQWRYGQFLLAEGRHAEAAIHLREANRYEPTEAAYKSVRARIRTDLADALLGTGELDEARDLYGRALQADPTQQRAVAGLLTVRYLSGAAPSDDEVVGEEFEGAGFELLLARGLAALGAGEAEAAKESLDLAAAADPLRAYEAWRALSYLAERTGNLEDSLEYIDLAELNAPSDPYTLIQRGRILAQRDDVDGAMAAFTAALDQELRLPDVLAAMGELELTSGDYEPAELFLERALSLDAGQAGVHALRGLNALYLNRPAEAEEYFDEALRLDGLNPMAGCGRAWCSYALGDATEAVTRFREFEDSRRSLPEEDPYRVYAREQIERIGDHAEKVVWTDRMERQELRNGWGRDEEVGPEVFMRDGKVLIEGAFAKAGRTRISREYNSGDFISFEAKLTLSTGTKARAGIFVALEQRSSSRGPAKVSAEVVLSRNLDGTIQYRSMRRGKESEPYVDSRVMSWPDNQEVTLRLERYGESAKTAFRVLVDGVPIADRVPMPSLGATSREIKVGVFAEGDPGHVVSMEIDDVEIVKRERN